MDLAQGLFGKQVSVPLRGKDRKKQDLTFFIYPVESNVSVPLRGKDRKKTSHPLLNLELVFDCFRPLAGKR